MALPVAVVGGDQAHSAHPVAGLFANLAYGSFGSGLADISPAARQRPATVIGLLDEQYLISIEYRRP